MTLADLNAARGTSTSTWYGYTIRRELAVGRAGAQNARRGTAGAHLHLLDIEVVTADAGVPEGSPATYGGRPLRRTPVGGVIGVRGCTTGNGQFTGTVVPGAELAQVTCSRCLARLARLTAAK